MTGAKPTRGKELRGRLGSRWASVLPVAWLLVVLPAVAFGEPPLSATERQGQFVYSVVVVAVVGTICLALGALCAFMLRPGRKVDLLFVLIAIACSVGWGALGWISGLIPLLLVIAAFAGAGRTM